MYLAGLQTSLKAGDLMLAAFRSGALAALPLLIRRVVVENELGHTRVDFELLPQPVLPPFVAPALAPGVVDPSGVALPIALNAATVDTYILQRSWSDATLVAFMEKNRWSADDLIDALSRRAATTPPPVEEGLFSFRARVAFFGHNAPRYESLPKTAEQETAVKLIASEMTNLASAKSGLTIQRAAAAIEQAGSAKIQAQASATDPKDWDAGGGRTIWTDSGGKNYTLIDGYDAYLERGLPELLDSSWAIFESPNAAAPRTPYWVAAVTESSLADYAISARSTGMKLENASRTGTLDEKAFKVRKSTAHVQSERLALADLPIVEPVPQGAFSLMLCTLVLGLRLGQSLILSGEQYDAPGVIRSERVVLSDIRHEGGYTVLFFQSGLQYGYVRSTLTINANVALATHGETKRDVLGSGDASLPLQKFALKQAPLTFISSTSAGGAASTLEVRVNDLLWDAVPTLYGRGPRDRVYSIKVDEGGKATVQFGDGRAGARLPTGAENVAATYRVGIGLAGNVKAGQLSLLMTRPLGVRGVANPLPASGAEDAEALDRARENAPFTVLTLDRIVSLRDFEDFARAFAGIGKAHATWLWAGETRLVHITVGAADGSAIDPTSLLYQNLRLAIDGARDPIQRVQVELVHPIAVQCGGQGAGQARVPQGSGAGGGRRRAAAGLRVRAPRVRPGGDEERGAGGDPIGRRGRGGRPGYAIYRREAGPLERCPAGARGPLGRRRRHADGQGGRAADPEPRRRRPDGDAIMSSLTTNKLYELLPAIYRVRDAEQGSPLRALIAVIAGQAAVVEADIARLYDNWFVETCDEWVAPYIGDLLGVRGLHPIDEATFSRRAQVANTLGYRRRKGTAAMLEQLARDATGWNARAVEFFELLATTQHVNHVRPRNLRTPDLRQADTLELLDTPFDTIAHTADVRRIAIGRGKHNIPNVGLFLWRLQAYPLADADAFAHAGGRFSFSQLGHDIPLFNLPQTEEQITHLAAEVNVPGVLRRRALYEELEALRQARADGVEPRLAFFGDEPVVKITLPDDPDPEILPEEIMICNLSDWRVPPVSREYIRLDGTVAVLPIRAAVDPLLGRLVFPAGVAPTTVLVSYAYGFSAGVGGGPYERRRPFPRPGQPAPLGPDTIADPEEAGVLIRVPADAATITDALAAWDPTEPRTIIQIEDSRTYREDLAPALGTGELVIQAANTKRPTLFGDIVTTGGSGQARLVLNGLLIAGSLQVQGNLPELSIAHCTLVPGRRLDQGGLPLDGGRASIVVDAANDRLRLEIDHSITGPLRVPAGMAHLTIRDSVVDAPEPRPLPVLASGSLALFPVLSSATPTLAVTIGAVGPRNVVLGSVPATLAQARDQLQAALRAADADPGFANARVVIAGNRLVVLPGVAGEVLIAAAAADPTATELRLDAAQARQVHTLVGRPLTPFPALAAPAPVLQVTIGGEGPHAATFDAVPASPAQARDQLQAAIRGAHTTPAFTGALVALADDQLVVLPGADREAVTFDGAPGDQTTVRQLGLEQGRPALAADISGDQPGPPTTIERSTIFGALHVQELTLASNTIFGAPALADRRQSGCVRFSFLPAGSLVPQRHRCQPDLAIQQAIERARAQNEALSPAQQEQSGAAIRAWLQPSFTDRRYGQPGYAQLGLACPGEIRTGADDEAEMGVFNQLQQPQREANLRTNLDEYLRFGLEAGIFYVT